MNYYNVQCCGFAIEYQQFDLSGYNTTHPVKKDQRFNFSITLAGIGSFSNFFGALGGGTRHPAILRRATGVADRRWNHD